MSEFKVGQLWKRIDGKIVEILNITDDGVMQVEDPKGSDLGPWDYRLDGKWYRICYDEPHPRDLTEQVFEIKGDWTKPVETVNVKMKVLTEGGGKDKAAERKATPVFSGVLNYFPDAIREVAKASHAGNEQHNPGQPLHWDKSKSTDHKDCLVRHLMDHEENPVDNDGVFHLAKVAWRALAHLQTYLEKRNEETLSD